MQFRRDRHTLSVEFRIDCEVEMRRVRVRLGRCWKGDDAQLLLWRSISRWAEEERIEIVRADARKLYLCFKGACIQPIPSGLMGFDGTTYTLTFEHWKNQVVYRWWEELPPEWHTAGRGDGMRSGENVDDQTPAWDFATWEGARREALRRWARLPLERLIAALEEMQELSDMLRSSCAGADAGYATGYESSPVK